MLADQAGRRLVHARHIEPAVHQQRTAGIQARACAPIEYQVAIGACHRRVAGVKVLRHLARPAHTDIRWQRAVHAQYPGIGGALLLAVEVRHLRAGMDTRVSAASGRQPDGCRRHRGDCGREQ